ncbi:MAG: outer membrane beta-barrel protein [Candidatus Omnitrophota bacterium]|jgi:hypothetical protein
MPAAAKTGRLVLFGIKKEVIVFFPRKKVLAVLILVSFTNLSSVFADTGLSEVEELKKEIAVMQERLNAMETRLRQSEMKTSAIEKEKKTAETGIQAAVTSLAKEIEFHGFVDTSYILNTNTPKSPNPRTNNFRIFDTDANGFMFNMAQLNFEKPISKESPVGFRTDLDFGQDAKLIHANGLGDPNDVFDLQQAYAQLMIPFSIPFVDTLSFKAGKYVTLMGAEVIESVNNWNFSRSFLFGYAIPFTHLGVRAYYKPLAEVPVDAYIGIVNGWDNVVDNNAAKTLEAQINYYPNDNLSFSIGGMFGPERADNNRDFRDLIDFVATYKVTDKLTLKANYDYGWEKNGATYLPSSGDSPTATGLDDKDASWQGIALYAKYDIYDWWSLAGRCEYFSDPQGVRTGVFVNNNGMDHLDLMEYTLTSEFKIFKNLIARLEYRYDKASNQVFFKDKVTANNQSTFAAEMIYKF